jgi:hypothetical protein
LFEPEIVVCHKSVSQNFLFSPIPNRAESTS